MNREEIFAGLDVRALYSEIIPSFKPNGAANVNCRCLFHDDAHASLSVNVETGVYKCHMRDCGATGSPVDMLMHVRGIEAGDALRELTARVGGATVERRIVKTYDYHDEAGTLVYQVVRYVPKDFKQRRPDGRGGWVWNMQNITRVLYGFPKVIEAVANGWTIYKCEGEKDCEAINATVANGSGIVATCNTGGAGKWDAACSKVLAGASVVVVQHRDEAGRKDAGDVAASLRSLGCTVRVVEAKTGNDAHDHLAAGHSLEELVPVEDAPAPTGDSDSEKFTLQPRPLTDVIATFRRHVYAPDVRVILAPLAAYAAHRLPGEQVWLLMVGPSGGGKTEAINSLSALPDVFACSTLTEAALLSGTAKRDKSKDAKGGLLREIGEDGVIVLKDFTSILSMHRDARAAVLAALREIYDGSYTRRVGVDGGKCLAWSGRIGLVGAVTGVIDSHHAVMALMGERFLLFRMPDLDRATMSRQALRHARGGTKMRAEIAEAVAGLMAGLDVTTEPAELTESELSEIVTISDYVALARSPVERDSYRREIELVPGAEVPTRIAIALARFLAGLRAIGASEADAWSTLRKTAFDCIPAVRRRVLEVLAGNDEMKSAEVAEATGKPTVTARRALEDLHAYGMVDRVLGSNADKWSIVARFRDTAIVSEMSVGVRSEEAP